MELLFPFLYHPPHSVCPFQQWKGLIEQLHAAEGESTESAFTLSARPSPLMAVLQYLGNFFGTREVGIFISIAVELRLPWKRITFRWSDLFLTKNFFP